MNEDPQPFGRGPSILPWGVALSYALLCCTIFLPEWWSVLDLGVYIIWGIALYGVWTIIRYFLRRWVRELVQQQLTAQEQAHTARRSREV